MAEPNNRELRQDNFEEVVKYTDLKITYVEHLSVINYLTKAIEDILIGKLALLKFPLLLIDLPLMLAVLIVNLERMFYVYIIEFILAYIKFDIRPVTKNVKKIIPIDHTEDRMIEEEEEDEIHEETTTGKLFQWLRGIVRFLWGLLILALILPIWPILMLYNFFVAIVIIGSLYYMLMFVPFTGIIGGIIYYLAFCTVTFLVASVSVPALLRVFTYVKYLFSLERKPWREINNEAKLAFLQFYLQVQQNRKKLLETAQTKYDVAYEVEGGIYHLLSKIVRSIKNKIFNLRKRNATELLHKVEGKMQKIGTELEEEKKQYIQSISQMKPQELFKTAIALLITFVISGLVAMGGSHGHGVLISIFRSFIDHDIGTTVWWNYEGSGMGYYQYSTAAKAIPGFIKIIVTGIDKFWGYFFMAYHYILPQYALIIMQYYAYMGRIVTTIFY